MTAIFYQWHTATRVDRYMLQYFDEHAEQDGVDASSRGNKMPGNDSSGTWNGSQVSTWSFLEAILQYPDVQQKARAEIEAVVSDRLPEFADLEHIPYLRCMMKEDITYNVHRIPKGARIHLNAWAISHDPRRHENPDCFWPERYTDYHTTTMQSVNSPDVTKRDHFAFGAGRRICPG
ncbi:cytochrome P450 [Penicillium macrosclerotiorum]|uniref:cytochrome P450 n=1 Tax=Penicillium macrosclerotiorum TaxID=303699 RepID=UPI0025484EAA|nr:cytochrome P450 [Penicillium macrosclerotiorum]KAJ5698576.1 cytochrome P450 [Penicillium macrosclerotiorum]